jgi:predicted AAA+ superfamily ATPase
LAASYRGPQAAVLTRRLAGPRRFIQLVPGRRQLGKTTLLVGGDGIAVGEFLAEPVEHWVRR